MNGPADPAQSHAFPTVSPPRLWVLFFDDSCGAHLAVSALSSHYGAMRSRWKSNVKQDLVIFVAGGKGQPGFDQRWGQPWSGEPNPCCQHAWRPSSCQAGWL